MNIWQHSLMIWLWCGSLIFSPHQKACDEFWTSYASNFKLNNTESDYICRYMASCGLLAKMTVVRKPTFCFLAFCILVLSSLRNHIINKLGATSTKPLEIWVLLIAFLEINLLGQLKILTSIDWDTLSSHSIKYVTQKFKPCTTCKYAVFL